MYTNEARKLITDDLTAHLPLEWRNNDGYFEGNNDGQALAEAQSSLALARLALGDLRAGIAGLTYPACREVWRE